MVIYETLTFHQLCKLLEADIAASPKPSAAADCELLFKYEEVDACPTTPFVNRSFGLEDRGMVSYETFFESYWHHFPQSLIKGLGELHKIIFSLLDLCQDPALVYSEFMGSFQLIVSRRATKCSAGVIKGSEDALTCPKRYLGKDEYRDLSFRTRSTFATQRDAIYTLFESYLRRKCECNEYDPADR